MRRTINFLVNLGEDIQEKKYSIGFLLDLSGSMMGRPLDQMKTAINNLLNSSAIGGGILNLANQISILTFDTKVQKVCPWIDDEDFDFLREFLFNVPGMDDAIMKGGGSTALYDGMAEILNSCYKDARLENERIILIISDGCDCGEEKHTKTDIEKLVLKQNQGFINESEISDIVLKYSKEDLNKIFEKVKGENYYLYKKETNKDIICQIIEDSKNQKILIDAVTATRKPARICSLYYRDEGASPKGRIILQDFADLSCGVVFDAPDTDSIPVVLEDLFHNLQYGEKTGIRQELIERLKRCPVSGNPDWFRVFSLNSFNIEAGEKSIENPTGHSIFNIPASNCKKRNDALTKFTGFKSAGNNIQQLLFTNLADQNLSFGPGIDTNPYIFVTFRGNDLFATSIVNQLYDTLEEIRNDPMDILGTPVTDYHFFLIILIDRLRYYSDEDKKNLAALLNEINTFDPAFKKNHGVFLIGERNDHFKANPDGYKTLSEADFEQSVIGSLFNLNFNQNLALAAYLEGLEGRKDKSLSNDRFLSTGNVSIHADKEEFLNAITSKFCHDLLINLYDNSFITDEDSVKSRIESFLTEISFTSIKSRVLQSDEGLNLLSRFDCPSALGIDFVDNWDEIKLKYIDQTNPGLQYLTRSISNGSFIEYIKYLFFDVRNYVESCHAPGTFQSVVVERATAFLKSKIVQLHNITNQLMYGDHLSSPRQAELWIDGLFERLDKYINEEFSFEKNNDPDIKAYSVFTYRIKGLKITDDDPETPLKELKEKLENYPLPISARFKFYSLAGLLLSGPLIFLSFGFSPLLWLLSFLLPLFVVIWGEYRIAQNKRQLLKLINWYALAHRHNARKQALEFVSDQINQMLIDLKNKIRKENDIPQLDHIYSDDLTEKNYLELLRNALTESLPKYFKYEFKEASGSSRFNIDLTKGYYDFNNQHVEIIDEGNIEKIMHLDKTWNDYFSKLIDINGTVTKYSFPTVKLTFIPVDFIGQLTKVSEKEGVNLLMKLNLTTIIPEKLFYLTLLDTLNSKEITELKSIFNNKTWHFKIDTLINLGNKIIKSENTSFFSLWREVGFYQAWLNKISIDVANDNENTLSIKTDFLFKLWKKIYQARKVFRNKLKENSSYLLSAQIEDQFNLWSIIIKSQNKTKLINHIKNYAFSPIYLTNAGNSYTTYTKLNYLASEEYLSNNLHSKFHHNLQSLLEDNRIWKEINNPAGNSLLFNHFVVIPFRDHSLLRSLSSILNTSDFLNNDEGSWRDYFLAEFVNNYLKKKNQRKEFKWLFQ